MTHHLDATTRLLPPARNPRQPAWDSPARALAKKARRANVEVGAECITVPLSDIPAPTAPLCMELEPMATPKKPTPIPACRKQPVEPCSLALFVAGAIGLLLAASIAGAAFVHVVQAGVSQAVAAVQASVSAPQAQKDAQ